MYTKLKNYKCKNKNKTYIPFRNSPIIWELLVNAIVGNVAKGNWRVIIAFKISFMPVKLSISLKNATRKVGTIAIIRVKRTRFQRAHCRFKNPSIANCPAYVPVIVEDWPAAKIPTAQIYIAAAPNAQPRNMPPLLRSIEIVVFSFCKEQIEI